MSTQLPGLVAKSVFEGNNIVATPKSIPRLPNKFFLLKPRDIK